MRLLLAHLLHRTSELTVHCYAIIAWTSSYCSCFFMTILDAQDEKSAFGELPAAVLHASETCGDSFVHVTQESVYLPRLPFTESVLPCWHAAKATSMLNDHASTISHAGDVAG